MANGRERWFADMLQAGLDTELATEQDVLAHATPAVLISALPKDVLARVLGGALSANAISPRSIVETASVPLLAETVPPDILWACIAQIAERAGVTTGSPADPDRAREWLRRTLASALDTGVLAARDVIEHVDAEVLATCFPDDVTTRLLEASLAAGTLTPELILETLGVAAIARYAPVELVWACFVTPGAPTIAEPAKPAAAAARPASKTATKPEIEVVEEEVATILVDLDEETSKQPPGISAKPG